MNHPAHTPYDGSARPFTIGLKPLDPASWIEVDEAYDAYRTEKQRLYAELPDQVFVAQPDTEEAQAEVLDMVTDHLECHAATLFPTPAARVWRARAAADAAAAGPALKAASLLIQEDLILMRRGDAGWRLAAGSLCFPSSWSLAEKFGRPLQDIHRPVPGFGPGTRMAELIHRMFDNLKVEQPVQRLNWSIQATDALYHPLSNTQRIDRAVQRPSKFPGGDPSSAFIRVERQTLRRLPRTGDLLFTIRIYLDPIRILLAQPDRQLLAFGLAEQLDGLETAQLDYKGLTADRDRLVALLRGIGAP